MLPGGHSWWPRHGHTSRSDSAVPRVTSEARVIRISLILSIITPEVMRYPQHDSDRDIKIIYCVRYTFSTHYCKLV